MEPGVCKDTGLFLLEGPKVAPGGRCATGGRPKWQPAPEAIAQDCPRRLPLHTGRRSVASMRTVTDWLGEYGSSHTNPTNKLLHWLCVPPIVLSVFGILWSAPVPEVFTDVSPWLNWATLAATAAIIYYFALSPTLALGVLLAFILLLLITQWLASLPWPLWLTSLVIFVIAWVGQFIGHAIEGKRPNQQELQVLEE